MPGKDRDPFGHDDLDEDEFEAEGGHFADGQSTSKDELAR
jgi:peptide deformylase